MAYTHVMESPMPHEEKDIHTKVLYRAKSELPLDHPISTFDELLNKQNFKYRLRKNTPKGIRIPVTSVKGKCPRPLDDGGDTVMENTIITL
eukprot:31393-Pelagococcus_subviridis.AAC.11